MRKNSSNQVVQADGHASKGSTPTATFRTIEPSILYFGNPVALISSLNEDGTTDLAPILLFGRSAGRAF